MGSTPSPTASTTTSYTAATIRTKRLSRQGTLAASNALRAHVASAGGANVAVSAALLWSIESTMATAALRTAECAGKPRCAVGQGVGQGASSRRRRLAAATHWVRLGFVPGEALPTLAVDALVLGAPTFTAPPSIAKFTNLVERKAPPRVDPNLVESYSSAHCQIYQDQPFQRRPEPRGE